MARIAAFSCKTCGHFNRAGDGSTTGSGGTVQNISANGFKLSGAQNVYLAYMNQQDANTTDGGGAGVCDANTIAGCNGAIKMTAVQNMILDHVDVNGAAEMGITGSNVTNFSMIDSTIRNAGGEADEGGLYIRELLGPDGFGTGSHITNSTIKFNYAFNAERQQRLAAPRA